ncbi:MAG: DNA/RNA non-specific endonuclease [Clostridia bacterium]|nr:DNA/RNA non-specific endonuclease [Clostridia bacterium]
MKKILALIALLLTLCMSFIGCDFLAPTEESSEESSSVINATLENIPEYSGNIYVTINDNQPSFEADEITTEAYEFYSPLDKLGRCGYAEACLGTELMPTEDRESISHVYPTGWVQAKYTGYVDGGYLYNRCHLIGFQLAGENDNELNLITGTKSLNNDGMLPFENMVADYIKETKNHVMYRVTPVFEGDNLLASGVLVEAYSVEDEGDGICFNIYVYNAQSGITIDYKTGKSYLSGEAPEETTTEETTTVESSVDANEIQKYVLNTNTKKFHKESCSSATDMKEENRSDYEGTREALIEQGYTPCGQCKP